MGISLISEGPLGKYYCGCGLDKGNDHYVKKYDGYVYLNSI